MKTQSDARKRVAEGLYRSTTSGVYSAHFRCNGRVIKKSLKTTELVVAKRKLRDLRAESESIDPQREDDTLRALAERHLALEEHRAVSTKKKKARIVRSMERLWPGIEGIDIIARRVKPSDVELWLSRATKGCRKSTRNEYLFVAKQIFERGVLDGVLCESPAKHIKVEKREAVRRLTPSVEEFEKIVDFVRENKTNSVHESSADFIEFIGHSGLGNGEVANILHQDVDLNRNRIFIRRVKTDTGFYIPIFPKLKPVVLRLTNNAASSPEDRLLSVKNVKKSLGAACRELGLPHYTHRSLRRLFITNAIERGVDVKVIAEWQGHRDGGKLILDTYSHVRRPHHDAMAKLLK